MSTSAEIRWIQTGIVGGILASILYPALLVLPGPAVAVTIAAAFLGPAIGIGSFGLRQLIKLHAASVTASLGAMANFMAGGLFTAMALVQLAVKQSAFDATLQRPLEAVWLGLDVAWDVYIGLGTVFFAWSMLSHPRFRWPFALVGFVIGFLLLFTNLYTFPMPPAAAGWIDIGPFVGFWYLAATVQAWRSIGWARERLEADG